MDYETNTLDFSQKENFTQFLDNEIGTEYIVNNDEPNKFNVVVMDLTPSGLRKARDFERTKLDESYEKFRAVYRVKSSKIVVLGDWNEDYLAVEDELEVISAKNGAENMEFRFILGNIEKDPHPIVKEGINTKEIAEIYSRMEYGFNQDGGTRWEIDLKYKYDDGRDMYLDKESNYFWSKVFNDLQLGNLNDGDLKLRVYKAEINKEGDEKSILNTEIPLIKGSKYFEYFVPDWAKDKFPDIVSDEEKYKIFISKMAKEMPRESILNGGSDETAVFGMYYGEGYNMDDFVKITGETLNGIEKEDKTPNDKINEQVACMKDKTKEMER